MCWKGFFVKKESMTDSQWNITKCCSRKCGRAMQKKYRHCDHCHAVYHAKVKLSKYCGKTCSGKAKQQARKQKRNADCLVCGRNFTWIGDRNRVVCSLSCEPKYKRIKNASKRYRECVICGTAYSTLGSLKKGKYCSVDCRAYRGHINYMQNEKKYIALWSKIK